MDELQKVVHQIEIEQATAREQNKTIFLKLDAIEKKLDDYMNIFMPRGECRTKDHMFGNLEKEFKEHITEHKSMNVKIIFSLLAALSSMAMLIIKGLK